MTDGDKILYKIGIKIENKKILQLLAQHGVQVDIHKMIVKIQPKVVEDSLRKCKKEFTLYGRDKTKMAKFGQNEINFLALDNINGLILLPLKEDCLPLLIFLHKSS